MSKNDSRLRPFDERPTDGRADTTPSKKRGLDVESTAATCVKESSQSGKFKWTTCGLLFLLPGGALWAPLYLGYCAAKQVGRSSVKDVTRLNPRMKINVEGATEKRKNDD